MRIDRTEAIRKAVALVHAHGGVVVRSFDGLVNRDERLIVRLDGCVLDDRCWAVRFERLAPPWISSIDPACSIVEVNVVSGEAKFFDAL